MICDLASNQEKAAQHYMEVILDRTFVMEGCGEYIFVSNVFEFKN